MYADFPDTADVRECVAQCVDGYVAPIERVVSRVYTDGNRMGVGEREGTLRPTDALTSKGCTSTTGARLHLNAT